MGNMCSTKHMYKEDPEVWYDSTTQLKVDYNLGTSLGEGMFAKVLVVTRRRDGARFAAKRFKKRASINEANEFSVAPSSSVLQREVVILRLLGGAHNCLCLKGVLETPADLYVLTELCGGGDVMQHIETQARFTEEDARTSVSV